MRRILLVAAAVLFSFAAWADTSSSAPRQRSNLKRRQFSWVYQGGVVLETNPDPSWATQNVPDKAGQVDLRVRSVDLRKLPADLLGWRGREVVTFDLGGKRCETTVVGLNLVGRLWDETGLSTQDEVNWVLVGRLDGCPDASWARDASLPAVEPIIPARLDRLLRKTAIQTVRGLDEEIAFGLDRLPERHEIVVRLFHGDQKTASFLTGSRIFMTTVCPKSVGTETKT